MFDFSEALLQIKKGNRVAREGWNGSNMYCEGQFPDEHSKMTYPYMTIVIPNVNGSKTTRILPWQPAQVDLFSTDWSVI